MLKYITHRFIWLIIILVIIATISFFIMRFTPGGPFDRERALPVAIEKNLKAKYNLDKPLIKQYFIYMKNLCKGDLGPSFKYRNRSVNEIIGSSFIVSLLIGSLALIIAFDVGVTLGMIAAVKQNSKYDYITMFISMIGISIPNFFLGILLIMLFSFHFKWLPPAGWGGMKHIILPVLTLAAPFTAYIARLMRSSMLEVLNQNYIRTARAKGLPDSIVITKHAFKNAILPVISYLGPAAASILTGSVVIEKIFAIPGLGSHFVNGALNRDYTLVMGTILLYSALLVVFNIIVDVTYLYLDPRIK
ncbi:MAG: ABC transporter permease [Candidatus Anammoxibacter sp.]